MKRMRELKRLIQTAVVAATLVPVAGAAAAATTISWATQDGNGVTLFQDHALARDSAAGANGTHAVGSWGNGGLLPLPQLAPKRRGYPRGRALRMGTYSGFDLSSASGSLFEVEVLLAGHLTAPLRSDQIEISLTRNGGTPIRMMVAQDDLNDHVGAGQAGVVATNFWSVQPLTQADLSTTFTVYVYCKGKGNDGSLLYLDAVGLRVTERDPNGVFDLRIVADPSQAAQSAVMLTDVSSPVTVSASSCLQPLCVMQILDAAGDTLPLGVALMPDGGTVRVGFDDGRWDAPVDAFASQVQGPGHGVANGVSTVRIDITICDASGWFLGAGLDVRIDAFDLGLATISDELVDRGDGRYYVELTSSTPGVATVTVTAEGVVLDQQVQVNFQ